MMNLPSNWDSIQGKDAGSFERLPAGAYCCRITKAYEYYSKNENKQFLVLELDVSDGEHAGFFANTLYPPKYYQGTGLDDGNEKKQSYFKGMITAIEQSNDGFKWNGDPSALTNRLVAVAFGEEEREKDGKVYTDTKPKFVRSLQALREGTIEVPKPKKLNGSNAAAGSSHVPPNASQPSNSGGFTPAGGLELEDDDDLPF